MINLLFLGLIPGTHIQITFATWLYSLVLAADIVGLWYIKKNIQPVLTVSIYFAAWQAKRNALATTLLA